MIPKVRNGSGDWHERPAEIVMKGLKERFLFGVEEWGGLPTGTVWHFQCPQTDLGSAETGVLDGVVIRARFQDDEAAALTDADVSEVGVPMQPALDFGHVVLDDEGLGHGSDGGILRTRPRISSGTDVPHSGSSSR